MKALGHVTPPTFCIYFVEMASAWPLDSVHYTCTICGRTKNLLGTIPVCHTDHSSFALICGACDAVLHSPALAIGHLNSHTHPLRHFCTSPPPRLTSMMFRFPPPNSEAFSSPDTVPESLMSSQLPASSLEDPLSPPRNVLLPQCSDSTLPPGQPCAAVVGA